LAQVTEIPATVVDYLFRLGHFRRSRNPRGGRRISARPRIDGVRDGFAAMRLRRFSRRLSTIAASGDRPSSSGVHFDFA
jgi:hypothetical protein